MIPTEGRTLTQATPVAAFVMVLAALFGPWASTAQQASTDYDFPIDVTIQLNNVGGPSAGMMFALGIMDTLTPGELNGGENLLDIARFGQRIARRAQPHALCRVFRGDGSALADWDSCSPV